MTYPQPILEAKPRPRFQDRIALMLLAHAIVGGPVVIVESIPLHPTQRPDSYSSPAYNEWENDQ